MIKHGMLRKWQKEAYEAWNQNNLTGIFLSCTGAGKSLAAMYCMQKRNVSTIIVVPTIALMNQWREEIKKHMGATTGAIGDGRYEIEKITVAVVNSVREMDLNGFDMIILDEVTRYGSDENLKPILNNKFKYKLGITAHLKRSDGGDKLLEELIGPIVYSYSTEDAVNDGVLSQFEIINVGIELDKDERERYDKHTARISQGGMTVYTAIAKMKNRRDPEWRQAVNIVRAVAWRKAIISNAKEKMTALLGIIKANPGKKIIIFNETIKMAELERKLLKKAGYKSEVYHSKAKDQSAIDRFKSGEVKILVSVKSLNEGLDVKDVDIGIRVAGNNQDGATIQRLGRGLRVVKGKDGAKYYQIYCKDTTKKWQVEKNTHVMKSAAKSVSWE